MARETAFLTSTENLVGYRPVPFYPDDRSVESWTEEGIGNNMFADLRTLSHGMYLFRLETITSDLLMSNPSLFQRQETLNIHPIQAKVGITDRRLLTTWVHQKWH